MNRRSLPIAVVAVLCAVAADAQLRDLLSQARQVAKRAAGQPVSQASAASEPAAASGETRMMLWVARNLGNRESALQSELSINAKLVNIFTGDTWEPIDQYLKTGWNTVTIKTTPREPADDFNDLIFRIGPARRDSKSKAMVMSPVLWRFRNGEPDWKLRDDGTLRHALGPKVREVEVTIPLYLSETAGESREIDNGDLVLIANPNFDTRSNTSVTATVFVNGTALTSFTSPERQIVITPFLKKGKNEIKIVSSRVKNAVEDNDIKITIAGPARWNATEEKYMLKPLMETSAMQGWVRDRESGHLVNRAKPGAETIERIIPLLLKDDENTTSN